MQIPVPVSTVGLLFCSNLFMTFAWYGHLRYRSAALPLVILTSWGIALFEYVLQVPANRIGYGYFSAAELKTIQEKYDEDKRRFTELLNQRSPRH